MILNIRWTSMLSVCFFALLGLQLLESMRIDTYELAGTRTQIIGYWLCIFISLFLGLYLWRKGRLLITPILSILFLIFYTTLILTLTSPDKSAIAFLASRYGLLTWFILGIGVSGMAEIFQIASHTHAARQIKPIFLLIIFTLGAISTVFSLTYLALPTPTPNYQSVSTNTGILLSSTIIGIESLWGNKKPTTLAIGYLIISTILTSSVLLMQSTSIAPIWAGLTAIFLWSTFRDSRINAKLTLAATLVVGLIYTVNTEAFERITTITRFNVFYGEDGEFSSLTSRLSILASFIDQFSISPITGNFKAEILSGAGEGNYIHSLPLSFLTHTGLFGTALIIISLAILLKARLFSIAHNNPSEQLITRIMLIVLVVGTISTFMTWSLFWLMMGVLCRRPTHTIERN